METTIVDRGYIGIMEKKKETTIRVGGLGLRFKTSPSMCTSQEKEIGGLAHISMKAPITLTVLVATSHKMYENCRKNNSKLPVAVTLLTTTAEITAQIAVRIQVATLIQSISSNTWYRLRTPMMSFMILMYPLCGNLW